MRCKAIIAAVGWLGGVFDSTVESVTPVKPKLVELFRGCNLFAPHDTAGYIIGMSTLLDSIIEPFADCLTPQSAERIVRLRADEVLQARVDLLADKANLGELTDLERAEYDRYLAAFHFVTLMQLRARRFLGS